MLLKKSVLLSVFLCGALLMLSSSSVYCDENETSFSIGVRQYLINGVVNEMDAEPYIDDNGRSMVPFRYLGAALGIPQDGVWWCETASSARMQKFANANVLSVKPDDAQLYVDDIPVLQMDTIPVNKDGRVYLPARYIAEAFGHSVDWDENANKVIIGRAGSYNGDRTLEALCANNNIAIQTGQTQTPPDASGNGTTGPVIYKETSEGIEVITSEGTTYITKTVSGNGIMMQLACDNFTLNYTSAGKPYSLLVLDPANQYGKVYSGICDNNEWSKDTHLRSEYRQLIADIIQKYKEYENRPIVLPKIPY